ncbi:MAG: hypothetical protein LT071_08850 [Nocardioides sp.]|nr:hypothetical protein [Nocardioides sp.]
MRTLALLLAALVAGALTGVATVFLHQQWWWLVLALLTGLLALVALPTRTPRVAWALASGLAVLMGAVPRPEGDYLVPANAAGWTVLIGAVASLLVALVLPDRRRERTTPVTPGGIDDPESVRPPT